jgi:DNA uptake protein ComE-like DNA-binding protein
VAERVSHRRSHARRQRGIALVVTIAIVLALASLLFVFARQMQTEALASRNHVSATEARLIAEGVARAIVADLADSIATGQPPELTLVTPEGGVVGEGAYWIIRPNFEDDRTQDYGLVREGAKVNINTAPVELLEGLPDVTPDIAAAIVDWRDADSDVTSNGAEAGYYLSQRPSCMPKDGPFDTLGELLLVRNVTRDMLYGEDRNRNGVLDDNENDAGDLGPSDNGDGKLDRGLYDLLTVYSREPNTVPGTTEPRVNVNDAQFNEIQTSLQAVLDSTRASALGGLIVQNRPYNSLLQMYIRNEVTPDEAALLEPRLTAAAGQQQLGRLDITTAPVEILRLLPGLEEGDAEKIIGARQSDSIALASPLWVVDAIGQEKAVVIGPGITSRSYQFSADIVAVSHDGRAFSRLRVVIDTATATATVPPRIVFMEDLTALGWPLDPQILLDLRAGATADDVAGDYGSGL